MTRLLALFAIVAALAGCGQTSSTFGGKICHQSKVVTSGVIFFLGPAPEMRMGMGTIHDDGTYTATDVPVGRVRVSLQCPGVPAKYRDPNTSGLVYDILAGTGTLDIDVP